MEKYRKNLDEVSYSGERMRREKQITKLLLAVTLAISTLAPGCVYHRNGSNSPHLLEYEHPNAEVVYPWRITDEFTQEYRFKILASIMIWFAGPIEILEGMAKIDPVKMVSLFPAIPHGFKNDAERIRRITESSRQRRGEEQLTRSLEEAQLHPPNEFR